MVKAVAARSEMIVGAFMMVCMYESMYVQWLERKESLRLVEGDEGARVMGSEGGRGS